MPNGLSVHMQNKMITSAKVPPEIRSIKVPEMGKCKRKYLIGVTAYSQIRIYVLKLRGRVAPNS